MKYRTGIWQQGTKDVENATHFTYYSKEASLWTLGYSHHKRVIEP